MVTVGVGRTEGHMSTASVFQRCHISQSLLSVLSVFSAKNQCGECNKCMKQVSMFMSDGVKSLTLVSAREISIQQFSSLNYITI